MLRICALNESSSEDEVDAENEQGETKEAQEAHLLDLYNSALQAVVKGNTKKATEQLCEITQSPLFSENEGSEQIQQTLRYNVHKNLAECYSKSGELLLAEDHFFQASQIDRTDVSLWFSLAGVAAKLNHLHMCRGALEEGLSCSPNHWPCLENLMVVSFKLDDNMGCLTYCELALERDPEHQKAKLYKSKVYNEMPFLREALNDMAFIPQHTELESYYYLPPPPKPKPFMKATLPSVTFVGLAECLINIYETVETLDIINPIDTASLIPDCKRRIREAEESRIQVSVQNLVEEMIDIVEEDEDKEMMCEDILEELLCDYFGVDPPTESEKIVRNLMGDIVDEAVETSENFNKGRRRGGVILDSKGRPAKKHFSIFDEVPEDLIEKRRSTRKVLTGTQPSLATSADSSQEVISRSGTADPTDMLFSLLPPSLRLGADQSPVKPLAPSATNASPSTPVAKKSLFGAVSQPWLDIEDEERRVEALLAEHPRSALMELMRGFMDTMYKLAVERTNMPWPQELITVIGKVYTNWRRHWATELNYQNPEEHFTQELLRYYIMGNECRLLPFILAKNKVGAGKKVEQDQGGEGKVVAEEQLQLPEELADSAARDVLELVTLVTDLPVELVIRVRTLRFHFFCLCEDQDEAYWESRLLSDLYEERGNVPVVLPTSAYPIVTPAFIEQHTANLARARQLEQLNTYFQEERYAEIVTLLSATLDSCSSFTPSKESAARTPDRESQIDIYVESLFHTGQWARCFKWAEIGFHCYFRRITRVTESGDHRSPTKLEWDTIGSYLSIFDSCMEQLPDNNAALAELPLSNASRMAGNLVRIMAAQVMDDGLCFSSALPWILLYKLTCWKEKEEVDQAVPSGSLPASLALLNTAHELLGQKSACTLEQGRLLNYTVDKLVDLMKEPKNLGCTEQMKAMLEQSVYCLYAHPSKKSRNRHLQDHNVSQIGLKWDRALVLFNYYKPKKLPEHDDVKTASISIDAEALLRRIVALIPDKVKIDKRKASAMDFLTGKTKRLKGLKKCGKLPQEVKDLFYLLADFNFKSNSEMDKAIEFYAIDLSFNRERFDTWAALALAQGSKMDHKLNSCRETSPQTMLSEIASVEKCFKECLRINGLNSNLWIEFGNFSYSVHSFISRTLQNSSENLNFDMFDKLEAKKDDYLKLSLANYQKTLDIFHTEGINENDVDERWLLLFMIGKIKEKQGVKLSECLNSYIQSINFLKNNDVVLPRRVNYNSPPDFAIEALEVYFRIHASILKSILKAEKEKKELDEEERTIYYQTMRTVQLEEMFTSNTPWRKERWEGKKRKLEGGEEPAPKVTREDETSTTIMRDVLEVVDSLVEEVEWTNDTTKYSVSSLTKLAVLGLEDVVTTFPHHSKALYRLAHFFHNSPSNYHVGRVRQLLLALPTDRKQQYPGLFGGRKPNLIFNEVWRVPVSEVDRPGSFAAHCGKALTLLLDVLKSIPDVETLVDISVQLRKPPSEENKFLHESDRKEIVMVASTYLNTALKSIVARVDINKERQRPHESLEMYKRYQKLLKVWPGKEKDILVHMKELYAKIRGRLDEKDKISDSEVIKFCAQEASKARALANQKLNPMQAGNKVVPGVSGGATISKVAPSATLQAEAKTAAATSAEWAQWSKVVADQQRMLQFQQMLAMAPSLPNMTANDMASICGLKASDVAGLREYMQGIMAMNCQQLAQLGITSSQLSSLALLSSLTGVSQASVQAQARKQAEFEQNYLRDLIGGNTAGASSKAQPSSSSPASGMTSKQSTTQQQSSATSNKIQNLGLQKTVAFKAKPTQPTGVSQARKPGTGNPMPQLKSTTVTKFPGATVTPVSVPSSSNTSGLSSSMSSTVQKLSSSGVTLSKPSGTAMPRNLPQGVSVSSNQQPNPDLAKKFPHLNITNLASEGSQATSKPGPTAGRAVGRGAGVRPMGTLQVRSPAQILKPSAAAGAAQLRKTTPEGMRPQGSQGAKQKLAEFKEQMKRTLNMPGAQRKPAPKPPTAKAAIAKPGQASVGAPGARPLQGGSIRPVAQSAVKSQVALGARPPSRKTPPPPPPKPGGSGDDVICIDID